MDIAHNDPQLDRLGAPGDFHEDVNLGMYFGTLVAAKWMILGVTAAVILLGLVYSVLIPPTYTADALVQVEQNTRSADPVLGQLADLVGTEGTEVADEIEIIQSRMVVGGAVNQLHLQIVSKPRCFPLFGCAVARHRRDSTAPWLARVLGLTHYAWGPAAIQITTLDIPDAAPHSFRLVTGPDDRYDLFDEDRHLILHGKVGEMDMADLETGQLRIVVPAIKAAAGVEFQIHVVSHLKAISTLLNALTVKERGKDSGIVSMKLEGHDAVQTTEIMAAIAGAFLQQNVERRAAEPAQRLSFLTAQLPRKKAQLETAETALSEFRSQHKAVDLDSEAKVVLTNSANVQNQRVMHMQKREELLQTFTADSPEVKTLDTEIRDLDQQQADIERRIQLMPADQQQLLRLQMEVDVDTTLYSTMLTGAQDLELTKAGTVGNVRIIDLPVRPESPTWPKPLQVALFSGLLGLLLGIAVAFLRDSFIVGVTDPEQLESQIGLPVYGTIPYSKNQMSIYRRVLRSGESTALLALSNAEDIAIEGLRGLRTALHFASLDSPNNILSLTGPGPGVGKSFVSANLACMLAQAGKKVLLIDSDFRRGHLHRYFGAESAVPGLSELIGGAEAAAVLRHGPVPNLDYISRGTMPPAPTELLMHERFAEFLRKFGSEYDHVIVDCAPVLAVTDAGIIGALAGTNLLVLKAGLHTRREIEAAIKRMRRSGAKVRGLVFNQVKRTVTRYGYGYTQGSYHYQYEYKSSED